MSVGSYFRPTVIMNNRLFNDEVDTTILTFLSDSAYAAVSRCCRRLLVLSTDNEVCRLRLSHYSGHVMPPKLIYDLDYRKLYLGMSRAPRAEWLAVGAEFDSLEVVKWLYQPGDLVNRQEACIRALNAAARREVWQSSRFSWRRAGEGLDERRSGAGGGQE